MSSSLPARRASQPVDEAAGVDLAMLEASGPCDEAELSAVLSWLFSSKG